MITKYLHLILAQKRIAYAALNAELCVTTVGGDLELLGFDAGACGTRLTELVPEFIGSEETLSDVLHGKETSFTLPRINRDNAASGELWYLDFSVLVNPSEEDVRAVFVVEDVTRLAHTEQVLTQQRNELSLLRDELADQNMALATANAELHQLDLLKSRFVTIAAHELRSPLATVSGYVDLLEETEICGELNEMQRNSVGVIRRSTERLLHMVSNLLDLTRIEAGRLDLALQTVDVVAHVHQVLRELKPLLAEKEHELTTSFADDLPMALCDPERNIQILHNLISNAVKYTPPRGQIHVAVSPDHDAAFLRLAVTDTGIGIPKEEQPRLFEAFYRAGNVDEVNASGSGLGLGIARSLVELHGGAMWFESAPNHGSHFAYTLPVADYTASLSGH